MSLKYDSGRYLIYRLMFITFDILYNDLALLYKLKLFRACTIPW